MHLDHSSEAEPARVESNIGSKKKKKKRLIKTDSADGIVQEIFMNSVTGAGRE